MQKSLAVIDLRRIRQNALFIRSRLGSKKFYAVVKADAYGHGAVEVAHCISDIADGFCVAIVEEGVALRISGVTKPVLVFAPPADSGDLLRAEAYGLTLTVNSVETAVKVKGACQIKVNTGMNRYGCDISELPQILKILDTSKIEGVYSHLYAAENYRASIDQLKLFNVAERLVKAVNPDICAHLSASGGLLRGGGFLKDGARCGILLYGYAPDGFNAAVEPALKVYAKRSQQTRFIGGGAGYGFAQKNYKELSTYRLGYADGFFRGVPLGENKLCMDAFVKENGGDVECVMDDAGRYARRANTIPYEVLTSVTRRSQRIYLK